MADSPAVRTRRSRAHARGDHSLCNPDRCADAGEPLPSSSTGDELGERGARLWREMTSQVAAPLGPAQLVLLEEACRMADRLDRLNGVLCSREEETWLRFDVREDGTEVRVVIDGVLSEARQQATALRGLVAELARTAGRVPKPLPGPNGSAGTGAQSGVADLTTRIADRLASATPR